MADKEKIEKEEYVPHHVKVEKAKQEIRDKKAFQKEPEVKASPEDLRLGEALARLMESVDFRIYLEAESKEITHVLKNSFMPKAPGVMVPKEMVGTQRSYGESMSYNEGDLHGSLRMKTYRQKVLLNYAQWQKSQKKEVKPHGEN